MACHGKPYVHLRATGTAVSRCALGRLETGMRQPACLLACMAAAAAHSAWGVPGLGDVLCHKWWCTRCVLETGPLCASWRALLPAGLHGLTCGSMQVACRWLAADWSNGAQVASFSGD
jgi:hypothetical protein